MMAAQLLRAVEAAGHGREVERQQAEHHAEEDQACSHIFTSFRLPADVLESFCGRAVKPRGTTVVPAPRGEIT
jgi:hypothetical protein